MEENIKSTMQARLFCGLGTGLILGPVLGLIGGLYGTPVDALILGLTGLALGLIHGLLFELIGAIFIWLKLSQEVKRDPLSQWVHDNITRWQHHRLQRRLKRKLLEGEWAGVPDRSISRIQGWVEEPTTASLSLANQSEEVPSRLTTGVEKETAEMAVEAEESP